MRNRVFGLVAGVAGLAVALSGTAAAAVPGGMATKTPPGRDWDDVRQVVNEPSTVLSLAGPGSQVERMFPDKVTDRAQIALQTDLRFTIKLDSMPSGNGTYITAVTARSKADTDYRAKIVVQPNGRVVVSVIDRRNGVETVEESAIVPGLVVDQSLPELAVHVTTGVTRPDDMTPYLGMDVTVWKAGDPEPQEPAVTEEWTGLGDRRDLHKPGAVGVIAYASSAGAKAPSMVQIDNLTAFAPYGGFDENYVCEGFAERDAGAGWRRAYCIDRLDLGAEWSSAPGLSTIQAADMLNGYGLMTFDRAGQTRATEITGVVPARDVVIDAMFSLDKILDGRGTTVSVGARKTAAGQYQAKVVVTETGYTLYLTKTVNGVETFLASHAFPGAPTVKSSYGVSLTVKGNELNATLKSSREGVVVSGEVSATDADLALQAPGTYSVSGYVSSSVTKPQQVIEFGSFIVQAPRP